MPKVSDREEVEVRRTVIVVLIVALALLALAPAAMANRPVDCVESSVGGTTVAWLVFSDPAQADSVQVKQCPPAWVQSHSA